MRTETSTERLFAFSEARMFTADAELHPYYHHCWDLSVVPTRTWYHTVPCLRYYDNQGCGRMKTKTISCESLSAISRVHHTRISLDKQKWQVSELMFVCVSILRMAFDDRSRSTRGCCLKRRIHMFESGIRVEFILSSNVGLEALKVGDFLLDIAHIQQNHIGLK